MLNFQYSTKKKIYIVQNQYIYMKIAIYKSGSTLSISLWILSSSIRNAYHYKLFSVYLFIYYIHIFTSQFFYGINSQCTLYKYIIKTEYKIRLLIYYY